MGYVYRDDKGYNILRGEMNARRSQGFADNNNSIYMYNVVYQPGILFPLVYDAGG